MNTEWHDIYDIFCDMTSDTTNPTWYHRPIVIGAAFDSVAPLWLPGRVKGFMMVIVIVIGSSLLMEKCPQKLCENKPSLTRQVLTDMTNYFCARDRSLMLWLWCFVSWTIGKNYAIFNIVDNDQCLWFKKKKRFFYRKYCMKWEENVNNGCLFQMVIDYNTVTLYPW